MNKILRKYASLEAVRRGGNSQITRELKLYIEFICKIVAELKTKHNKTRQ